MPAPAKLASRNTKKRPRVFAVYEAALREHGALDYPDLMHRPVRLLTENQSVRRAEQAQWKHVLVDEYQDVNRAGAQMLQLLTGDNSAGLWAVRRCAAGHLSVSGRVPCQCIAL